MSKKDKSKFRKRIKAQILQEMAKAQTQEVKSGAGSVTLKQVINPPVVVPQKSSAHSALASSSTLALQNLPQIIADLKKTGLVIIILIILIIGLRLLDQKYLLLPSLGDLVFRVLHIQ